MVAYRLQIVTYYPQHILFNLLIYGHLSKIQLRFQIQNNEYIAPMNYHVSLKMKVGVTLFLAILTTRGLLADVTYQGDSWAWDLEPQFTGL